MSKEENVDMDDVVARSLDIVEDYLEGCQEDGVLSDDQQENIGQYIGALGKYIDAQIGTLVYWGISPSYAIPCGEVKPPGCSETLSGEDVEKLKKMSEELKGNFTVEQCQ